MPQSNHDDPRERAHQYRNQLQEEPPPPKTPGKMRNEQEWSDLISQRIEEAMAAGAFDNLPGKGRPINVGPEPFVPADMQMANSLLKNNNLSPAWISERKETLAAISAFRSQVAKAKATYMQALGTAHDQERRQNVERAWQAQITRWRQEVIQLNRRIETYNLQQPLAHLEIFKINLDNDLT